MKVVGIGNSAFGDDAVGLELAKKFSSLFDVVLLDNPSITDLLDVMEGELLIIDSTLAIPPGEVKLWRLEDLTPPQVPTSHELSLAEAIALNLFRGKSVRGYLAGVGVSSVEPRIGISKSIDIDATFRKLTHLLKI